MSIFDNLNAGSKNNMQGFPDYENKEILFQSNADTSATATKDGYVQFIVEQDIFHYQESVDVGINVGGYHFVVVNPEGHVPFSFSSALYPIKEGDSIAIAVSTDNTPVTCYYFPFRDASNGGNNEGTIITSTSIRSALGYTPADADDVDNLTERVETLEQNGTGGAFKEDIEKAVNDYLEENPVHAGATKEQAEQIQKNTEDIAELKDAGTENSNAITNTAKGEAIVLHDSSEAGLKGLKVFGKSTQVSTPTSSAQQDIESVGDDGNINVDVNGAEGEAQSLLIPTPNGLAGIEVTDSAIATHIDESGKMWCADEMDLESGKYVQRIGKYEFNGTEAMNDYGTEATYPFPHMSKTPMLCTHTTYGTGVAWANDSYFKFNISHFEVSTMAEFKTVLAEQYANGTPVTVYYILAEPIETDIAEVEGYKSLKTYYPSTTITNDADAYMEVEHVADTKNYIDNKVDDIEIPSGGSGEQWTKNQEITIDESVSILQIDVPSVKKVMLIGSLRLNDENNTLNTGDKKVVVCVNKEHLPVSYDSVNIRQNGYYPIMWEIEKRGGFTSVIGTGSLNGSTSNIVTSNIKRYGWGNQDLGETIDKLFLKSIETGYLIGSGSKLEVWVAQ